MNIDTNRNSGSARLARTCALAARCALLAALVAPLGASAYEIQFSVTAGASEPDQIGDETAFDFASRGAATSNSNRDLGAKLSYTSALGAFGRASALPSAADPDGAGPTRSISDFLGSHGVRTRPVVTLPGNQVNGGRNESADADDARALINRHCYRELADGTVRVCAPSFSAAYNTPNGFGSPAGTTSSGRTAVRSAAAPYLLSTSPRLTLASRWSDPYWGNRIGSPGTNGNQYVTTTLGGIFATTVTAQNVGEPALAGLLLAGVVGGGLWRRRSRTKRA